LLPQLMQADWKDRHTVAVALGLKLPDKRLTKAEKLLIQRQADKIINRELRRLLDDVPIDFEMKALLRTWVKQRERRPGHPSAHPSRKPMIIDALAVEKTKSPRLSREQILYRVGKRFNIGVEQMKKIAGPWRNIKTERSTLDIIVNRLKRGKPKPE
jgi:hypothetical protein